MSEAAKSEKISAEIPYGVVEYAAVFKKPIISTLAVPASIIEVILEALGPYGFKIDGVEVKTHTEKPAEAAVVFKRTPPGITLTLQLAKLTIVAENLDWSDAEQFLTAAHTAIDVVLAKAEAETQSQHVGLAIHIQLKTTPRQEVVSPLLSSTAYKLLDGELKFPGIILQREKASIVVDASLAFANALFVRINREHGGEVALEEMAEVLRSDEQRLFDILGLEGAL